MTGRRPTSACCPTDCFRLFLIGGFFLLADIRRHRALAVGSAWGAFLVGLAVFQLFDGIVDHKVLRLHQVRYGVEDIVPYDLAWNLGGVALLLVGVLVLWRTRGEGNSQPASTDSASR